MSANIEAKKLVVEEIKNKINASKSVVFVSYKGINVEQDTALRKAFRAGEVEYKVYKNRLILKAFEELGIKDYDATLLEGTTSVAFAKDEVSAASILYKMNKDFNNVLSAKFGILDGKVIDAKQIEALSKIPSKDVLIAMLMGMLKAPVSALARAKYYLRLRRK